MKIYSANNNLTKVISSNSVFSAQKQKKGITLPTKTDRSDKIMADYSRLQGGYLIDAVFRMIDLYGAEDVYDECS